MHLIDQLKADPNYEVEEEKGDEFYTLVVSRGGEVLFSKKRIIKCRRENLRPLYGAQLRQVLEAKGLI